VRAGLASCPPSFTGSGLRTPATQQHGLRVKDSSNPTPPKPGQIKVSAKAGLAHGDHRLNKPGPYAADPRPSARSEVVRQTTFR
jgi:hypothetical protein